MKAYLITYKQYSNNLYCRAVVDTPEKANEILKEYENSVVEEIEVNKVYENDEICLDVGCDCGEYYDYDED